MNVALVSTSVPPYADSHTVRMRQLLGALPPSSLRIVAPGGVTGARGDGDWPAEASVVRTAAHPHARRDARLARLPGARLTRWALANVAYRLSRPDLHAGWERQAEGALEAMLAEWPVDVLVSSSGSATAHMAAAIVARRHGLPWVCDFGDPWHLVDRVHRPWLARWSAIAEPRTIAGADRIVFTTEATRDAYRAWLGDALPTAEVIPYGYTASDLARLGATPTDGAVVFAHVGAAHTADRPLQPLIAALGALAEPRPGRLGITLVGNHSRAFDTAAAAHEPALVVESRQRVSFAESLAWMARSHWLVIVGNVSPLQVPGKLFMCLAASRPILYLAQRRLDDDPGVALLRDLPGVLVVPNRPDAIEAALAGVVDDGTTWQAAAARRTTLPAVTRYEAAAIGERFRALLADVAGDRARGAAGAVR